MIRCVKCGINFESKSVFSDHVCPAFALDAAPDFINHPPHYTKHPSGVECITITEHMGFNIGNAIKYLWRADEKGAALDDLRKAIWYINREIDKRGGVR